jgi:hypothetical protein
MSAAANGTTVTVRVSQPERHLDPDATGSPLSMLPGLDTDADRGTAVAILVGQAAAATRRGQLMTKVQGRD